MKNREKEKVPFRLKEFEGVRSKVAEEINRPKQASENDNPTPRRSAPKVIEKEIIIILVVNNYIFF
jgi:hypothetical protein